MKLSYLVFLAITALYLFPGCEDDDAKDIKEQLYVQFANSSESEFTITNIQILNMGVA